MIDTLIKGIVGDKLGDWTGMLVEKFGFSSDQAGGFIPAMIEKVTSLFSEGGLDFGDGFDVSSIIEKLNPAELADKVGIDASKATEGLQGLMPDLLGSLQEKAGGAEGLMSMLSGGKGGIGGIVGKLGGLFGK